MNSNRRTIYFQFVEPTLEKFKLKSLESEMCIEIIKNSKIVEKKTEKNFSKAHLIYFQIIHDFFLLK